MILKNNKNFVLLWITQVLFHIGNELVNLGAMLSIYQQTGSVFKSVGVFVVRMLPGGKRELYEEAKKSRPSFKHSSKQGFNYLQKNRVARSLTIMEFLESWASGIWNPALILAFTHQVLKAGPEVWGYQVAAYMGGRLIGASSAILLSKPFSRYSGKVIIACAFTFSFFTIIYALSPNAGIAIVVSFLFGPFGSMRDVTQDALLQAKVDERFLGRLYATRQMLVHLSMLLSAIIFSFLADIFPVRNIIIMAGVFYGMSAVYAAGQSVIRNSHLS